MNRLYRGGKHPCYLAKDFDEAYALEFFNGSMHKYEFMDRITKHNSSLRWFANATHKALWDTSKGENGFICGITHMSTIPKYSIMEYNFKNDRSLTYCNMYGEVTGKEIVNQDEFEYKVLAQGWEVTFDILERKGYKIDRENL